MEKIRISESFRKMAAKSIAAIIFFIVIYFLLVLLGVIFAFLCGYGGLAIIMLRPSLITIAVGAGVVSLGLFILFFLVKFMFSKHKADLSHLVEVTAEQEPELFKIIGDIVMDVKTDFPKKVYFSSNVNAAVFYDSSFWSMVFPVRKNLEIGIGLMNSVSTEELKAILAHEFGHFSQKSMKIGSYVYNVNKVIYNMLYENESFGELIQRWANVNVYISFFMRIAVKIIQGIQWVLRKTYGIVNKNYMGLSREMEFHADEVAANFAGSDPLISSLLRLDLANYSYSAVINHYNERIHESVRSEDVYAGQQFVLQFEGRKSKLDFSYGLPMINKSYLNKFNKSRLVVEDQWSSHPSTIDRVNRLESLNISKKGSDQRIAVEILRDRQKWQKDLTNLLFAPVTYSATPVNEPPEDFETKYSMCQNTRVFPEIYLGYYDGRNPIKADINNWMLTDANANDISFDDLFNDSIMDTIYTADSMVRDIVSLKHIHLSTDIKTFDYDGQKYSSSDGPVVAEYVAEELGRLNKILQKHDEKIMLYFLQVASRTGKGNEFAEIYKDYSEYDTEFDKKYEAYINLVNASSFMHETTPYDEIERLLINMKESERAFRIHVKELLAIPGYSKFITQEQKHQFENFISGELIYFTRPEYNDEALKLLFDCINYYYHAVSERYYFLKNELLKFQELLLVSEQTGRSRQISAA